jgi:hypothetical protein
MHQPLVVRVLQGVAELLNDRQRLRGRQRAALQEVTQVLAVDVFHGERVEPIAVAEIVDRDDVRMIEPGQGLGFAGEARREGSIAGHLRRQDFDSYQTIQLGLPRLVHRSHAALAEQCQELQLWKVPA